MDRLHADRAVRVVLATEELDWVASPAPGVERRMLDREGAEVARATSIVRYAPASRFSQHVHGAGEEFLVLEGVFSDEHGHYPAGTYVRNPWETRHSPYTTHGCIILVKLRQMTQDDRRQVVLDTRKGRWLPSPWPGIEVQPLHQHGAETVTLERWEAGAVADEHDHPGGEEMLILEGDLEDGEGSYPRLTWLRQPAGSRHHPRSASGCLLWVKRGHL